MTALILLLFLSINANAQLRINLGDKAYDITKTPIEVMQKLRGNYISMIFQEPMTSLNPVFRIGDQINEVIELHESKKSADEIKATWQDDITRFKAQRKPYLLYQE